MKKLLIISLLFITSQLFAQNTTQVRGTNGIVNIPSTKVNGNVKIGLDTNGLSAGTVFHYNGTTYQWTNFDNLYPKQWMIDHSQSIVDAGNANAYNNSSTAWKCGGWFQVPSAISNRFHSFITLRNGTYDFNAIGSATSSSGIQRWDLVSESGITNTIGSMDWYNAAPLTTLRKTLANIVITNSGTYKIQSTVTNQNGSSFGYNIELIEYGFQRVGN